MISQMISDQPLVMERHDNSLEVPGRAAPGIRTILFHVLDDEFNDQRIETAIALSRACSAHLSCVHITPIEASIASSRFGDIFVMNDIIKALDERDHALRNRIEERLGRDDVSWDYEQVTGNVAPMLLGRAALSDLLVTARECRSGGFAGSSVGFLGDLLHASRTPLFVPGSEGGSPDPTGTAVIAWDGSIAAANAVRSARGLLTLASEVLVLEVPEHKVADGRNFPATKVLEYLSRHGVHAELVVEQSPSGHAGPDVVSGMLVAQARGAGAAYIVMGGYSHSRVGEYVFGGVTRTLLKECPVPLLIAH